MALGVAVMIAVIVIYGVTVRQFEQNAQGYHLIVGGKGGSLQLVLSTVYHIGQPLYPIPYTYYQKFLPGGEFADRDRGRDSAVPGRQLPGARRRTCFASSPRRPTCSTRSTTAAIPTARRRRYEFQPGGRNFKTRATSSARRFRSARRRRLVARRSRASRSATKFNPRTASAAKGHKHDGFKVVGILKPTGTANDRAVFINIEGFYLLEGHALAARRRCRSTRTSAAADHDARRSTNTMRPCRKRHGA